MQQDFDAKEQDNVEEQIAELEAEAEAEAGGANGDGEGEEADHLSQSR